MPPRRPVPSILPPSSQPVLAGEARDVHGMPPRLLGGFLPPPVPLPLCRDEGEVLYSGPGGRILEAHHVRRDRLERRKGRLSRSSQSLSGVGS